MHIGTQMQKQTVFSEVKIVCLLVGKNPKPLYTPVSVAAHPKDAFCTGVLDDANVTSASFLKSP